MFGRNLREMFGLDTIDTANTGSGIFRGMNLEQIVDHQGEQAILEANERARAAYEATLRKRGETNWTTNLPSERDQ